MVKESESRFLGIGIVPPLILSSTVRCCKGDCGRTGDAARGLKGEKGLRGGPASGKVKSTTTMMMRGFMGVAWCFRPVARAASRKHTRGKTNKNTDGEAPGGKAQAGRRQHARKDNLSRLPKAHVSKRANVPWTIKCCNTVTAKYTALHCDIHVFIRGAASPTATPNHHRHRLAGMGLGMDARYQ